MFCCIASLIIVPGYFDLCKGERLMRLVTQTWSQVRYGKADLSHSAPLSHESTQPSSKAADVQLLVTDFAFLRVCICGSSLVIYGSLSSAKLTVDAIYALRAVTTQKASIYRLQCSNTFMCTSTSSLEFTQRLQILRRLPTIVPHQTGYTLELTDPGIAHTFIQETLACRHHRAFSP